MSSQYFDISRNPIRRHLYACICNCIIYQFSINQFMGISRFSRLLHELFDRIKILSVFCITEFVFLVLADCDRNRVTRFALGHDLASAYYLYRTLADNRCKHIAVFRILGNWYCWIKHFSHSFIFYCGTTRFRGSEASHGSYSSKVFYNNEKRA